MKNIFKVICLILWTTNLIAQNGKLVEKTIVTFPDSIHQRFITNPSFSEFHTNTDLFKISYISDELKINGYLAQPKVPGTYPIIIFNRGGFRDTGSLDDVLANFILREMASWGYVVAASNYRGGGGSEGMDELGGKDVNDIHNLIPLLANEKMADTTRIGIYGNSRGGLMTYRVLAETCHFKAAIVGAGMANSIRLIKEKPELEQRVYSELIPDYTNNKEEALQARSAVYWADKLCSTTPIMLLHGSSDRIVPPEDALDMASELFKNNHPFRFHFYEGGDHGLSQFRPQRSHAVREFFDFYVKDRNPLPNLEKQGR